MKRKDPEYMKNHTKSFPPYQCIYFGLNTNEKEFDGLKPLRFEFVILARTNRTNKTVFI